MKIKKTKKVNLKKVAIWAILLVPLAFIISFGLWEILKPVAETQSAGPGIMAAPSTDDAYIKGFAAIGAGIASIGLIGAGIGQGNAAGKAAEAVARNPEAEAKIRSIFIVGAAIAESSALYAFVVAIMIIFVM